MRLYNTRTRTVEPFAPLRDQTVRMYVCGLTPSAEAHIGHARSFLFFDVLRRYLAHQGYAVTYVQNVTDIDDRSIVASRNTGVAWKTLVERYYASFKSSMRRLGVREPDQEPRATDFIAQIIEMTGRLIAAGHAYVTGDGVYFKVKSFPRYGEFSGRNVDELLIGARIAPGEEKENPLDFALWKFVKPGEPSWPSPWGDGRPGWHIECSAMTHALLGEPFDIHGGGYDLIFPHHENEIAQSESLIAHPPMANVWMHGGLLTFDGKKMSKSLGNFEPLHALLDRHDAQAIRLLFLQTGYRKPMNFNEDSIAAATEGLRKLLDAYDALALAARHEQSVPPVLDSLTSTGSGTVPLTSEPTRGDLETRSPAVLVFRSYRQRFCDALDDDMNTAAAVAELFKLAGDANVRLLIEEKQAAAAEAFFREAMDLLGISPLERSAAFQRKAPLLKRDTVERLRACVGDLVTLNGDGVEEAVRKIIDARNVARKAKNFALADRLRVALAEVSITLTDEKEGTTWSIAG